MPPDRADDFHLILDRIRRGERVDHYQTKRRRKDGQVIDVSLTVSPIRDAESQIIGISKIARDITEQMRHEAELRQAKDAAEFANRAKDQFLAMLSHELRTPLAPVLLETTAALSDPATPSELLPAFRIIRDGVQLQARLVDDLLDVTRIIRGKMVYCFEVVDMHETIQRAWKHCLSELQGKQQRIVLDLTATAHHVQGDPTRLQQVLFNLLKNASKFSPEQSEIRITTRNHGERLLVLIIDQGIGIDPDYLPRIFDAFDQSEETIKRRLGGLGLGLGISRAIAEAHGGTLTPASEGQNRGATFTLDLPTTSSPALLPGQTTPPSTPEPIRRRLRVLLVEDDPATADVTQRLLRHNGYEVATARTIAEALQTRLEDFQILVCDIGLPDGNGFDLMRQVKARRDLPGIALTGFGMDGDIEKSRQAGFTAHLVKPIEFDKLDETIQNVAASG
jgi:signal transduction histidine kinase